MDSTLFESPAATITAEVPHEVGEIEGRAHAIVGGAQHFDQEFPDQRPRCEQCDQPFDRRQGSGGKTQKFCTTECRLAWHTAHPKAQRSPTYSNEQPLAAATISPEPKIAPAPTQEDSNDFDWFKDKHDVVVPSQPATAVYWCPLGHLVIRQEGTFSHDEDQTVYVQPQNLPALIDRLQTEYHSWKRDR